jgi:hypothetical protein
MSIITGDGRIPELILPEYICCEEIQHYDEFSLERCPCGSSLFRNYNESIAEGVDVQQICAKCGMRIGGMRDPHNMELHYYNNDTMHPFMCIPIEERAIKAFFAIDEESEEPEALRFIAHLKRCGYDVKELKTIVVTKNDRRNISSPTTPESVD